MTVVENWMSVQLRVLGCQDRLVRTGLTETIVLILRDEHARRPFVRFFACNEDLSHQSPDAPLPIAVASGAEPFILLGAIAGGD